MRHEADLPPAQAQPGKWERIEDYLRPLRRRGSAWRRGLSARLARDGDDHAFLSTLPFVALLGGLALLSVIIFGLALPGNYSQHAPRAASQPAELGTAPPGWIDGDRSSG